MTASLIEFFSKHRFKKSGAPSSNSGLGYRTMCIEMDSLHCNEHIYGLGLLIDY